MTGHAGGRESDRPDDRGESAPWELEVAALLGGLPSVEPPIGFLERAVDHRPLYAGRTVVALAALAAVGFGFTVIATPADPDPTSSAVAPTADQTADEGSGSVFDGPLATAGLDRSLTAQVGDGAQGLARRLGFPSP